MWFLTYYPASFQVGQTQNSVNKLSKMNDSNSETQLVFPFLDEQPPETYENTGQLGGQTNYVEAEQFIFPLFPTKEYFIKIDQLKKQNYE